MRLAIPRQMTNRKKARMYRMLTLSLKSLYFYILFSFSKYIKYTKMKFSTNNVLMITNKIRGLISTVSVTLF